MSAASIVDQIVFNGVNGTTGEYLLRPLSPAELAAIARGEQLDKRHVKELEFWHERVTRETMGPRAGIDPSKLEETGWAVIFAFDERPEVRAALKELLDWRKEHSTKNGPYYREYWGPDGYRPGETKTAFLARHGAGMDAANPEKVPYYLLIVGDPNKIPYKFQYELDVQYAVGRIHFDNVDDYARYAHSVVAAERGEVRLARKAVFFGTKNRDDRATDLSATELVKPLAADVSPALKKGQPPWVLATCIGGKATKAQLSNLLGGNQTPAFLFTASHGMGFNLDDPRQLSDQGALLCQDWPGPVRWREPISPDHYFAAHDVSDSARLAGLISFHFACYGAGTPRLDDYPNQINVHPPEIAEKAFVARLPQRMLAHPHGGALAVVGHVERAWGCSITSPVAGRQIDAFVDTAKLLMEGWPVGAALEFFNSRYAALATSLTTMLEEIRFGRKYDDYEIGGLWTAHNDSRSYVIVGDPAARLSLASAGEPERRPELVASVRSAASPPASVGRSTSAIGQAPRGSKSSAQLPDAYPASFAAQCHAAEQRFAENSKRGVKSFSTAASAPQLVQENDPARIRRRLVKLGMPQADVEQFIEIGTPFGVLSPAYRKVAIASGPGPSGDAASPSSPSPSPPSSALDLVLERILGRNDMVDSHFLEAGSQVARAVGRIRIRSASAAPVGFGTGSLIGSRLLLTNNHVLENEGQALGSLLELRVEDLPGGASTTPVVFRLAPGDFFLTDIHLDFTLVAVEERNASGANLSDFAFNPGSQGDEPVLVGEFVNIIQHPGGRPKQVALRDNQVTDLLEEFLHYRADTSPGSSGAPVFNDQWQLVGLHHSGVPRRDVNGNILARGGGIWRESMGDDRIDWIANEGIRISRILKFIADAPLSGATASRLRSALLANSVTEGLIPALDDPTRPARSDRRVDGHDAQRGTALGPAIDQLARDHAVASAVATTGPPKSDSSRTLTIPLHVTISLGAVTADIDVPVADQAALSSVAPAVSTAEAISIDPDYEDRAGYDPEFLGRGSLAVPLPKLTPEMLAQVAAPLDPAPGDNQHELKYHHYSVVMNGQRRLAYFTAANIDGSKSRAIHRETDKWFFDPRISREEQVGNELYATNPFDRGHLVRRLDPAWGRTAKIAKVANDDTFHFTNCSPQHERFNQGKNLWAGLEDYLLDRADDEDQRLTIFTGPIFRDDDPVYRDVAIPREFWKVAVLVHDEALVSAAFIVSQEELIRPVVREAAIDVARLFQTTVTHVQELTGLDFGELSEVDIEDVVSFEAQSTPRRELNEIDEMRFIGQAEAPATFGKSFGAGATSGAAPGTLPTGAVRVEGTPLRYFLLAYDDQAREREGAVSDRIVAELAREPVTDVFLFSHGWQGDVPAANRQYQDWISAMYRCEEDLGRARRDRPGFKPLLVGLHWPSLPWGDERLNIPGPFATSAMASDIETLVDDYALRLGNAAAIRDDVRRVLEAARDRQEADELPDDIAEAYLAINDAIDLPADGVAAAPGRDRESFDPRAVYREFRRDLGPGPSFSLFSRDTLLAPLRTLSFWKMKDRARVIGESAVHPLLTRLQTAAAGRNIRFHLIGHSFGCIVASAALAGGPSSTRSPQAVASLTLLQGALSHWSFANRIPDADANGYFRRIVTAGLVRGPIVSTQSMHDTAVGVWYPRAAWAGGQVAFAPQSFPKYGGVGTFGVQGSGLQINGVGMASRLEPYRFRSGNFYNVDGSEFINKRQGLSGAHSDIAKSEVAHLVWEVLRHSGI